MSLEIFNVSKDGREINLLLEEDTFVVYYYDDMTKDFVRKEMIDK
jgi:hypothetical protein